MSVSDAPRPDPDALLAALPRRRGRLKLFFGAAPLSGGAWVHAGAFYRSEKRSREFWVA